jgi:hypothetical protein
MSNTMLDHKFPGEKISVFSRRSASLNAVRRGEADIASAHACAPFNHRVVSTRLERLRSNRVDRLTQPDKAKKLSQRLAQSISDPSAASDINSYRNFILTNDVMATPFAMGAFQIADLSMDEQVMLEFPRSRNLQRFSVRSVSLDGSVRSDQWRQKKDFSQIEMEMIATDKVQYPLQDLQLGNLDEEAAVMDALQYDLDMRIDELALAQVNAAEASSGLRGLLSLHPKVIAANIPDTNVLDLTDTGTYGTANKITLPRLKAILNHIVMIGSADPTRAVNPTQFMISPQNKQDIWDFVSLVSGWDDSSINSDPKNVVPEGTRDSIFNTGAFSSAWGYTFQWSPNAQIAAGKMYIFMDQPLGWLFTKSDFDRTVKFDDTNSPTHAEYNYGEVMHRKAMRFYVPDLWKHRVVIVNF